jgi:hypothetical protein
MSLFTLSYEALIHSFVCGRFAEKQEFGDADVELWLAEQRTRDVPDVPRWHQYFKRDSAHSLLVSARGRAHELLERFATPMSADSLKNYPPQPDIEIGQPGHEMLAFLAAFITSIDLNRFDIYETCTNLRFVLINKQDACRLALRLEMNRAPQGRIEAGGLTRLTLADTLDVLLKIWRENYPRREETRAFLCNSMLDDIKNARWAAERDFGNATAVSRDGMDIIFAEWVIAIEPFSSEMSHHWKKAVAYPFQQFLGRKKVFLPEHIKRSTHRCSENLRPMNWKDVLDETARFHKTQIQSDINYPIFLTLVSEKDGQKATTVYMTPMKYLPEGIKAAGGFGTDI